MTNIALTVTQVAEILGIDRKAVTNLIKSSAIVASDISLNPSAGRARYRVLESDLQNFLDGRVHQPTPKRRRRRRKPTNVTQYF